MIPQEEVAQKLLQIKAIKLSPQNPFTWASGIQSPIYCDNRIVLSFPEIRSWFISQMISQINAFSPFEVIAGVATAGIPWGALVADRLNLPFIYVRSKAKGHGRQNLIEGSFHADQKVLVVEDLISTGGSSLKAVEALIEANLHVVGVIANFQYGLEESRIRFEEANIPLVTLSNYETLLHVAKDSGYIDSADLPTLREWSVAPNDWKPIV
jgi:orotate phosphoribosyltransferase